MTFRKLRCSNNQKWDKHEKLLKLIEEYDVIGVYVRVDLYILYVCVSAFAMPQNELRSF